MSEPPAVAPVDVTVVAVEWHRADALLLGRRELFACRMPVDAVRDVVSNRPIQEPRPRLLLPDALHGGTQATGEGVVELQELPCGGRRLWS
jgi:hypothetical protein